jgi:hypothetical protein
MRGVAVDEIRRTEPILKDGRDTGNRMENAEAAEQRTTNLQQPSEPCIPPLPQQRSASEGGPRGTAAIGSSAATAAAPAKTPIGESTDERGPLFSSEEAGDLRAQWDRIQVGFVDEPRTAVAEADQLVERTMKRLSEIFQDERQKMERQWDHGDKVSTEDFRLSLRRYRSFFGRLLSI